MVERKRLSAQICRVLAIVELLRSATSTISEIAEYVNQVVPEPVASRTIRRDVEALIAMGYCSVADTNGF
jgi:predicted DNA-binding transcriptional regulator YafY